MHDIPERIAQLNVAQVQISQCWERTKAVWNDQVQQYFDREFFVPLDQATYALGHALDRLSETLTRIEQTVE